MDETTVECDVLVRKHLLAHLKRESETHKKTILYATHVFDGMASWPTHLLHVSARGTVSVQEMSACADYQQLRKDWNCDKDSPLSALIEKWLTADHAERQVMKREKKELPKTVEQVLDSSGKVGDRMYNYWN
jgi:CCR4-NOT complex subunit CAF16